VTRPILPGSTIGVLGSGQLGRMFAMAARRMGYRVHTLSPDDDTPTGQIADVEITASYDDLDAIRSFARVQSEAELTAAITRLGTPAVLKTASFGYDGKGQVKVGSAGEALAAWNLMDRQEAVLERFIELDREVSLVVARGATGWVASYGLIENTHRDHILDTSVYPASVPPGVERRATELARGIAERLGLVGVLCVEFFLTGEGDLLVNELAPRPHNSGHLTIDACVASQFEQQLRAICGLPPGSTDLLRPAAMANLLGNLWSRGEPNWIAACLVPGVKLHLYGKAEPRPGRKMGHLTALARTPAEALELAVQARAALR
jgi:5-(carboxyamino)imidazole ribonucleotide synthase